MRRTAIAAVLTVALAFGSFGSVDSVQAISIPRITIDQGSCTVTNTAKAYVSGSIRPAVSQKVFLYSADRTTVIGSYRVTGGGGTATFRIKVPKDVLTGKTSTTLYVRSGATESVFASQYVAVSLTITGSSSGTGGSGSSSDTGGSGSSSDTGGSTNTGGTSTPAKATNSRPRTAAEGRAAAVAWAKMIAADNSFSYGATPYSKHNGCYFCGTNGGKKKKAKKTKWAKGYKGKKWEKTYCCNPFIHAAYAHGAKHPKMLKYCKKKHAIDMTKKTYRKMGCFKCLGKPKLSKLIPGDILVSGQHVSMYCGNGEIVEATSLGGGKKSWGASSIRVSKNAKKRHKNCRFIMRFTGY